jgi:hypothetical protein
VALTRAIQEFQVSQCLYQYHDWFRNTVKILNY